MESTDDDRRPKLPIDGMRNILITSALPYANNAPHLGNIIGCVLSADVFARYCRLRGYNTLYICGTDEYGTALETRALQENFSPREICDKYHAIHKEVYDWFNISFDIFGRTATPQHEVICQAVFKKGMENNLFEEHTMQQLYCNTCQRFLADRFVEGVCPYPDCNCDSARGDTCDQCGRTLNTTDLQDPRCKVCGTTPGIRDTYHLFMEIPLLKDRLEEYFNGMSVVGSWSQNAIRITNAFFKQGLQHRCITRDLEWGVPVPLETYKDKVFYIWFDAPIGYISITSSYTPEWEQWWKNPDNVELFQFMAKDNVQFHTIMFPSTLLGTGEPWTMVKTISATEFLNYEAGKFSKSKGLGVFGDDVMDTDIPVEVWRYYLLANRPEVSDTHFSWDDLQAKVNNELLNNLGNFVNRVLSFIAKPAGSGYDSFIPDGPSVEAHLLTNALTGKVENLVDQYIDAMEKLKLKHGLKVAMAISIEGNAYLQESQFWKLYKDDRSSCDIVMRTSAGLVYLLACLLEPFMPTFTIEVLEQLNLPLDKDFLSNDKRNLARKPWRFILSGHQIGTPRPIFKEIDDDKIKHLRNKFAGNQADRLTKAGAKKTALQLKKMKVSSKYEPKSESATAAERAITISRLDIRVGLITKAQRHPNADSLYVKEVDVGEPQPRTVVSGLVKYFPLEEMQGQKICVLCNLKPASMRGIKSQAVVLAVNNNNGTKVELVEPPETAIVGERVTFPGLEGKPDALLNPKEKVWERLQVDFRTDSGLVACYKDLPFTTSGGVCKVASIADGSICSLPNHQNRNQWRNGLRTLYDTFL